MTFVDFGELKARVSIEDAVQLLKIDMTRKGDQLRSACPHCGGSERTLVVTPAKGVYFCFKDGKGGDQIALAAHVLQIGVKDAAAFLAGTKPALTSNSTSKVPSSTVPEERRQGGERKLEPLPYLEFDHEAVQVNNLDPRVAERFGIGFAPKGTARGNVVIPVRDEHGTLHGYIGVQEITFLPKDFQAPENVVPFKKKA
jgi:DNA primase